MPFQAQMLICHPHRVNLSLTACVPPPPHTLEPNRLSERLSPTLDHVLLSLTARLPPQPCLFEPKCSSATPPCQFEHNRSSPTSTMHSQAQLLVPHLPYVLLSLNAHLPLPPCQFEPDRLCPTSTIRS